MYANYEIHLGYVEHLQGRLSHLDAMAAIFDLDLTANIPWIFHPQLGK